MTLLFAEPLRAREISSGARDEHEVCDVVDEVARATYRARARFIFCALRTA